MATDFSDTMFHCKFRNALQTCDQLFKEVITEEGICYTFNALNTDELYHKG